MSFFCGWVGTFVVSSGATNRVSGRILLGFCLDPVGGEESVLLFVTVAVFEPMSSVTLLLMVSSVVVGEG